MFGSSRRVARRTARRTSRRQAAFYGGGMDQGYEYDEPPPPPQQAAPAAAEPDYAVELEKLARLRDQQVISEEEFQAKKKQILGI